MIPESIISTATTVVKPFIEELIKSTLNEYAKKAKISYNKLLVPVGQHFEEYLNRTYNKFSVINVWALNNSKRRLKDIYVPLSIRMKQNRGQKTKVDRLPVQLIKDYKKILIIDTAGMGKSTMMRFMFIDLMEIGLKEVGIPIYIELNRLRKNWTILDEIKKQLNSLTKEFDNDLLLDLIRTEQFVFFLDGNDEIPVDDKTEVSNNLNEFISKAGERNYYILTSRPEDRLSSFDGFHHFDICDLIKEEAYGLLNKCDLSDQNETSKRLIAKLDSNEYEPIKEYLKNPLLVSLLYAAFEYSPDLPLKKHQFYRQVYDALFNRHDLSKGIDPHEKKSHLDIDDFSRILRFVGFECLKRGKINFDEDNILGLIRKAKERYSSLTFSESSFLEDLLLAVPLFTKDGTEYKWAHKSLMEYFAACFVAEDTRQNQDDYLKAIYNSQNLSQYINLLDLYFDIDEQGFSKTIMRPLLIDFVQYHDQYFRKFLKIEKNLVEERIGLYYGTFSFGIIRKYYFDEKDDKMKRRSNSNRDVLNDFIRKQLQDIKDSGKVIPGVIGTNNESQFLQMVRYADPNQYYFLSGLLFRKRPDLFVKSDVYLMQDEHNIEAAYELFKDRRIRIDNELNEIDIVCGNVYYNKNKVYEIGIMEGCDNEKLFKLINDIFFLSMPAGYYFSYDSVKLELERINREIEYTKNTSELLAGI